MRVLSELQAEAFGGNMQLVVPSWNDPLVIVDDFEVISSVAGNVGRMGWNFTNGSMGGVSGVAGRPGVALRTSGAVIAQVASMSLGNVPSNLTIIYNDIDSFTWIVALPTLTTCAFRLGLSSDWGGATPTNAVYFEKLTADTTWFGVCRDAGGAETRVALTGITVVAGTYYRLTARRVASADMRFRVDAGTEQSITTNVPTSSGGQPGNQIVPTAAAARTMKLDYFLCRTTALSR